jgi:hypothetical protein
MDTPRKYPRSYPYVAYYWYVPNPLTGRMRRTRYRLSEAEALQYPGAVKDIFDSAEIRAPGERERRS